MDFEKLDGMYDTCVAGGSLLWPSRSHDFIREYARQRRQVLDKETQDRAARLSKLEDRMDIVEKYCHSHVAGSECGYVPASFHCAREGDPEMSKILDTQMKNSKQNPRSYSEWEAQQRIPAGTAMYHVAGSPGTVCAKRQDDDEPITEGWLTDVGFVKTCRDRDEWRPKSYEGSMALIRTIAVTSIYRFHSVLLRTRRDLRLLCELLKIELKEGK